MPVAPTQPVTVSEFMRGSAVMGLVGKSGLQGLPTRVALPLRDIQLRLSKGASGVPLFTTWDSVAGPGRTPMPGNNSCRRQPGNSAVPSTVGRLGVDGFWVGETTGAWGVRVGLLLAQVVLSTGPFIKKFPCNHSVNINIIICFFRRSKRQRNFSLFYFAS